MKYKKKSAGAVALTLALVLLLTGCAATLGTAGNSGAGTTTPPNSEMLGSKNTENDNVKDNNSSGDTQINSTKRSGTATLYFYDDKMNEITKGDGWYKLPSKVTLRVKIDGEAPDLVSVYLTPTGTETADQR